MRISDWSSDVCSSDLSPHGRASMEKRVVFRHKTLPYLLLAPQIAVTLIFFFLPAGQAMWQSMQLQDAFGLSSEFVGLANFIDLFRQRSEERRVGQERVSTCRSWWSPDH